MKNDIEPVYHGKRVFLGLKDLVISLYTKKCQFDCSMCDLGSRSSDVDVPLPNLIKQIHWVFDQYEDELEDFKQLSVGNEGSILDRARFPELAMNYLLSRSLEIPELEVLSLETRPEYLNGPVLADVMKKNHAKRFDVTIGFETQDDRIRNDVLNKRLNRDSFEKKVKLLGDMGIRLTSFVMLKPDPFMTEVEGIKEAIATVEYLDGVCRAFNTDLVIYLNPTYIASSSPLGKVMKDVGYKPPKIQSLLETIRQSRHTNRPIYTGLWAENLADEKGDYTGVEGYDKAYRKAIKEFNKTQDFSVIESYGHISETRDSFSK